MLVRRLNNKGLTLIELIAAIAVMLIILLISVPSLSAIIERNKGVQDKKNIEILNSAVELYLDMYKAKFPTNIEEGIDKYNDFIIGACQIPISELKNKDLLESDFLDNSYYIYYDTHNKQYTYTTTNSNLCF